MTNWDTYLDAVASLDAVRRDAATAVAAQEQAAQATHAELTGVRQRVALQRGRLVDFATRQGWPALAVDPLDIDRSGVVAFAPPNGADPAPGVSAALKGAWATLDAADASLTFASQAPGGDGFLPAWPLAARIAVPYAWYSILAIVTVALINAFAHGSGGGTIIALFFDIAVPAGAYLIALLSVGWLYGRDTPRGALIGAMICAVPFVIGVVISVLG